MADLSTTYMGLKLKSPIIAASSGLTGTVEDIKGFAREGAGAVVIKSIFEEEIRKELEHDMDQMNRESFLYPETMDFYDNYMQDDALTRHLQLIREAKKAVDIPIIASVNCVTADKWPYYAETLQDAGADAIELNIFVLPSDPEHSAAENQELPYKVAKEVMNYVSIPVSLKISYYSADLANHIKGLSETGIKGLVLFNRFYSPDIDVNSMEIMSSHVLSSPGELPISLRWVAITSDRVSCDIAASTGVHDGIAAIKQLLAGASAVQVASAFYRHGKEYLAQMLGDMEKWMDQNGYTSISNFKGKLSYEKAKNPAAYERVQFMKHFSGYEG